MYNSRRNVPDGRRSILLPEGSDRYEQLCYLVRAYSSWDFSHWICNSHHIHNHRNLQKEIAALLNQQDGYLKAKFGERPLTVRSFFFYYTAFRPICQAFFSCYTYKLQLTFCNNLLIDIISLIMYNSRWNVPDGRRSNLLPEGSDRYELCNMGSASSGRNTCNKRYQSCSLHNHRNLQKEIAALRTNRTAIQQLNTNGSDRLRYVPSFFIIQLFALFVKHFFR